MDQKQILIRNVNLRRKQSVKERQKIFRDIPKHLGCLNCKSIIPSKQENFKEVKRINKFLKDHNGHMITLLLKSELQEFSKKRFNEYNYKLKKGVLHVQKNC